MREFEALGSSAKTIAEAKNCPKIKEAIAAGLKRTNERAISRAQHVQKFTILDADFSVDSGEMTPTLKLKRNVVQKNYAALIETLYIDSKL